MTFAVWLLCWVPLQFQESGPSDQPPEDVIESIEFRGARRVPQDSLRALIITRPGDKYNQEILNRDFTALWNTGRFDALPMAPDVGRTAWWAPFAGGELPLRPTI